MSHACPDFCHFCPDLDGAIMPNCWGGIDQETLDRCHCAVEEESAKEKGRRLMEERFLPEAIRTVLLEWIEAPPRGRRPTEP